MQAVGLLLGVGFDGGSKRNIEDAAAGILGLDNMPKDFGASDWAAAELSRGQICYAASDAIVVWRLWQSMQKQLREARRWDAYLLQRNAIPAVVQMELRGIGFDQQEHTRQTTQWAVELEQARTAYQAETGQPPPRKAAEITAWLHTVLSETELARWPRTSTRGDVSTKYEHLERLGHVPSARPVLDILAAEKMLGTFGPKLLDRISPVTGRLHCRFNIAATKAGRFSANDPNLQQFPSHRAPEFRKIASAREGYVLICCDYDQVELRAAAWMFGDIAMTDAYRRSDDLHKQNAAAIAGVPLEEVTPEQRKAAKAVSFGALYGISARGLVQTAYKSYKIEMTEAEAQNKLDRFFAGFPQLAQGRSDNYALIQRQGFVRIGAGRIVHASWEPYGKISFPQACNLPIQGVCADLMLRAIALTHSRLLAANIRGGLVATIHDELLAEVALDDAERARDIIMEAMTEAFIQTFPDAPTDGVVKAALGPHWAAAKA